MAGKFYGVRVTEQKTSTATPTSLTSGITIAFGTAPVQKVSGSVNQVVVAQTYEEAAAALGYSDDWDTYTLCEVMYTHFKLYGVAPVLFVNVLDPSKHKESVTDEEHSIVNGQAAITDDAIAETIVVKTGSTTLVAGTDYDVFYQDGACIIEALDEGKMKGASGVKVTYDKVSVESLTDLKTELIGGYDVTTGETTGLELMDKAYFAGGILPDMLIAPGFSHIPEIAAVMAAKTTFSTVFRASCICDLDTESAKTYQQAITTKEEDAAYQNIKQVVCWPMLGNGDLTFHMSTHYAALQGSVDADNGAIPSAVASNHQLMADKAVLADGTEIIMDINQANYLRNQGVVSAFNFVNGFTLWGAYNACYPVNTDVKDIFINISRMFGYIANTCILTFWSKIDRNLTPRFAENIVDQVNQRINSWTGSGHLLGGRCVMLASENSTADIMSGIVRIHIYATPPSPAQEVDFVLEYDASYVASAFGLDT